MRTRNFKLSFSSPAFLGDAEQNGAWRTPPIKALLRQWWRVAYAAAQDNFQVNVARMREEEAALFGHAGDEGASKSLVRLRLARWDGGKLKRTQWQAGDSILHPEVQRNVDALLYTGYGPVTLPRGAQSATLKANAAVQDGESAQLSLAWPGEADALMRQALWLMDRFGTLGGRGRNGWGSFSLTLEAGEALQGKLPLRNWQDCLRLDWPHAIGANGKPLIWQTCPKADWKQVMVELARLKIGLRMQFIFTTGKNAPKVEDRHWLSYPVTNHSVAAWGGNLRLPNSLRFKVRPTGNGQFSGV
ncbi:MAG: hypothetical protein LBE85_02070, partial [Candidatus Accumulibacter sp.]|nr:hypothetical protein [Accumulibacter sp.]